MRKAFTATIVLALALGLAQSPASADVARNGSVNVSAFGLSGTGLITLAPQPAVNLTGPPDVSDRRGAPVELPLDPLAFASAATARGDIHRLDDITPLLREANDNDQIDAALGNVNGRAYGAANVDVVGEIPGPPGGPELIETTLLSIDAIEGEAVAKCVGGRPRFDIGWDIADIDLAGQDNPLGLEDLVDGIIRVLNPSGVLAPVAAIATPADDPSLVRITPTGASVTAARITLLGLLGQPLETIEVGHAEVRMTDPCRPPQCDDLVDNDGDGKIDFGPDPGCESREDDDERDARPTGDRPALAATGGDNGGAMPMLAFGVLGAAVIVHRMTRTNRAARRTS